MGRFKVTGNHAHRAGSIGQGHLRNVRIQQRLVAGRGHLVLGWQVDPQLHHLERAARPGIGFGVELLVQYARGGRHPLHIAGAYGAASTRGVSVGHLAFVDDGHGLEAAVRVRAYAALFSRGCELMGTGVVQQQKGAQRLAVIAIAEQRTHWKAIAHPVRAWGFVDTQDFLEHGDFSLRRACSP